MGGGETQTKVLPDRGKKREGPQTHGRAQNQLVAKIEADKIGSSGKKGGNRGVPKEGWGKGCPDELRVRKKNKRKGRKRQTSLILKPRETAYKLIGEKCNGKIDKTETCMSESGKEREKGARFDNNVRGEGGGSRVGTAKVPIKEEGNGFRDREGSGNGSLIKKKKKKKKNRIRIKKILLAIKEGQEWFGTKIKPTNTRNKKKGAEKRGGSGQRSLRST